MGFIAIAGCGALGGALAHKLAGRDRVAEIRLIDPEGRIAQGKALDILQSVSRRTVLDPDHVRRRVDRGGGRRRRRSSGRWRVGKRARRRIRIDAGSAAGECLRSCADCVRRRRAARADRRAPPVELKVPRRRLLGSAPLALESAVRALAGVLLDTSGVDVALRIVGVPPNAAVVAWEEAAASGLPLSSQLPAHQIAMLSSKIRSLWPPGPYALASAASRVVEGLLGRSRRRFSCFVPLERGPVRDSVVAMPVELGAEGVRRVLEPSLTRQERTLLENAFEM